MKVRGLILGLAASFAVSASGADELATARAALRDGLWEVARSHAAKVDSPEARQIALESYASEERWADILAIARAGEGDLADDYYRLVANYKLGKTVAAAEIASRLAAAADSPFARKARLIAAEMEIDAGESARALKRLSGDASAEAKMVAARAHAAVGATAEAEKLWREVIAFTNADEKAVSVAAANLGDAEALRASYARASSASVRRFAGLRLGVQLIKSQDSFAEGEKLITMIARDVPDSDGAKDAFLLLAETHLDRGEFRLAAETFAEALETWPEVSKDASVQESRGRALAKLARREEAYEAFLLAEKMASDDAGRAMAVVQIGDLLTDEGKTDEAIRRYREVVEKYPDAPVAGKVRTAIKRWEAESRARDHFAAYRFEEAERIFRSLAEEDSSRAPRMKFFAVKCLYGQGRDLEAEALAKELASSAKDALIRAEANLWLAKLYFNRGLWPEAEERFAAAAANTENGELRASARLWSARAAFAAGDFAKAVKTCTAIVADKPAEAVAAAALLVQAEALIESARFDEAVLILDRIGTGDDGDMRLKVLELKADALFAMGADNPTRYQTALATYRSLLLGDKLSASSALVVSFKLARTLEKLKRLDEAIDQYYSQVVLAYRDGRRKDVKYDEAARSAFVRAAFHLAEEFESRGQERQAIRVLQLVTSSDVPSAEEAARRIERIRKKGRFL